MKLPPIKDIGAYAGNAIRVTTEGRIYVDSIFEHQRRTLRKPILSDVESMRHFGIDKYDK